MSQQNELFDGSNDPFMPSLGDGVVSCFDEDTLSNNLFAALEQDGTFSPAVLDDLDLNIDFDTPAESSDDSNTDTTAHASPTPDFGSYTFGQRNGMLPSIYPLTPGPDAPHPYPLQLQKQQQQQHQAAAVAFTHLNQPLHHRALPLRSPTNPNFLRPPPSTQRGRGTTRTNQPFHRRSLSQGDADRIAAATHPQFFRLQGQRTQSPRARSAVPEDEGRSKRNTARTVPYQSTKIYQGVHGMRKQRSNAPTSVPANMHTPALSRCGTPIGTPLPGSAPQTPLSYQESGGWQIRTGDMVFKHMSDQEKMAVSAKVIEIGGMAVIEACEQSREDEKRRILKVVEGVEERLRGEGKGKDAEALRGLGLVREALGECGKKVGSEGEDKERNESPLDSRDEGGSRLSAPSEVFSEADSEMYLSTGEDDLFGMMDEEGN